MGSAVMSMYSPSRIHQYVQHKHLSTTPIRLSFEERQSRVQNQNESALSSEHPRSHLQDDLLRSVLHDSSIDGGDRGVIKHENHGQMKEDGDALNENGYGAECGSGDGSNWMKSHFRS